MCEPYRLSNKLAIFLQFVPGSHKAGRIDHQKVAGQMEADEERVKYFADRLGIKNIELAPGLLHTK